MWVVYTYLLCKRLFIMRCFGKMLKEEQEATISIQQGANNLQYYIVSYLKGSYEEYKFHNSSSFLLQV